MRSQVYPKPMSDSNNNVNPYDLSGKGHLTLKTQTGDGSLGSSVESIGSITDLQYSTDDDCAFLSETAMVSRRKVVKSYSVKNSQYSRSYSRSSSQRSSSSSRRSSASSRSRSRQHAKANRLNRMGSGSDVIDDVINENEVTTFQRSQSNPPIMRIIDEHKSRLQRRRSAVTFQSTYRTLSAPPRLTPTRPSLSSLIAAATPSVTSMVSGADTCCYGYTFPRATPRSYRQGNWSNLMTCLAHKKENGVRMTQTQILIRKSLEKAIQKAGYNMNELALSNSPVASPMVSRKVEPKNKVDWGESAMIGEHIWAPTNVTGDLCYVGESLCQKSGSRKKCSACHIVVHEACMDQLGKIGFQCKITFREANSRNIRENLTVRHHWVHRRRQEGKCRQCGKVFEKRFGFRDSKILAISCSWCKEAYHNKVSCFRMQKINESCTLGAHARIIVPPTWIVKWTPRLKSVRNRSKKKRGSSGMWRKKSSKEGRQKLFVIRPLPEHSPYFTPTIVFINPKSGGNQGTKIMQTFQWLLNQRQVFNLAEGGPKEALEMFRKVQNLRILACGGDGTVGWILSVLDELNMARSPPVAILPLGTGNDLSRTLNWGPGYTDEPICKVLQHVEEARVVQLDRWKLTVTPNEQGEEEGENLASSEGSSCNVPLDVVNNYFSLGADARVSLEFHESREAHPSKFNSRIGNKFFYARAGVSGYLTSKLKNLGKSVTLVCDGRDLTPKIQALKPVCIVFLNIPKYSSGTMPWGNPTGSEFQPQMHDDKLIEVLGFTSNQLGMIFVGGHGERLCQCREAVITTTRTFPVQIDGEPCRLNPSVINLTFHNQVNMLYKTKHGRGSIPLIPDQPVSDQLKICINVVNFEQYEMHNGEKREIRGLSRPFHASVVPSDSTLDTIRSNIERIQQDSTHAEKLAEQFTFLDLSGSDRFYRVDRTQESLHMVRDVASSDGELFVLDETKPSLTKGPISELPSLPEELQILGPCLRSRAHQVDRTSVTRKRIYSDTTGTSTKNSFDFEKTSEETKVSPRKEKNATKTSEARKETENAATVNDDITKKSEKVYNDVTKEKLSASNVSEAGEAKKAIDDGDVTDGHKVLIKLEFDDVTDDVKRKSLPSKFTKAKAKKDFKTRPLSYAADNIDVINTDNSSKLLHCDITKANSFSSVFSLPQSSKSSSPRIHQDESTLWTSATSLTSLSSNECLVIVEEDETVPRDMTSEVAMTSLVNHPAPLLKLPYSHDDEQSLKVTKTSPEITIVNHDGTVNEVQFDGKREIPTLSDEEIEFLTRRARKNNSRGSRTKNSLDPSTKPQDAKPSEYLSVGKSSMLTRSPSPEASVKQAVTFTDFVHNLKDVPYKDEISTVADQSENSISPSQPIREEQRNLNSMGEGLKQPTPSQNVDTVTMETKQPVFNSVAMSKGHEPGSSTEDLKTKPLPGGGDSKVSINGIAPANITNGNQSNNKPELPSETLSRLNKQCLDASKRGDLGKLASAILAGADVTAMDGDGSSALHNAARFNHPDAVELLLRNGTPELLDMTDRDRQQTALHKAAWFGHKKICEVLVAAGASVSLLDYKKMTPLDRAQQAEDPGLVNFFTKVAVERMGTSNEDKETDL